MIMVTVTRITLTESVRITRVTTSEGCLASPTAKGMELTAVTLKTMKLIRAITK